MLHTQTEDEYPINVPMSFHGYSIMAILGCGSTSVVCLVENKITHQQFSAKIISKIDVENRHLLKSIYSEIELLRQLDNPHIVKLYDFFEVENDKKEMFIVIILEYCENGDLLTYATQHGFLSENQKKKILLGFLSAIKYLHSKGISHGDIKAENILLGKNYSAKLCDFGYSRTSLIAGDESKNGTLYYAAPELFFKGNFDTLKSDIWSIGITIYSISELQFPFKDGNQDFIVQQIIRGNLSIRPGIEKKLRALVERCTQKKPENRPTIDDLIKDDYFFIEFRQNLARKNYVMKKLTFGYLKDNYLNECAKTSRNEC